MAVEISAGSWIKIFPLAEALETNGKKWQRQPLLVSRNSVHLTWAIHISGLNVILAIHCYILRNAEFSSVFLRCDSEFDAIRKTKFTFFESESKIPQRSILTPQNV